MSRKTLPVALVVTLLGVVAVGVIVDELPTVALLLLAALTGVTAVLTMLYRPVWLLYLMAVVIPFSQSIPTVPLGGRVLHIGFDTLVIGVILAGCLLRVLLRGRLPWVPGSAPRRLLIWWAWTFCTLLLAIVRFSGEPVADAVIVFLRWSQYLPIFFIVLALDVRPDQIKIVVALFVLSAVLIAGMSVIEEVIIGVDRTMVRGTGLVLTGIFLEDAHINYNIPAAYLATTVLVFTPFVLVAKRRARLIGAVVIAFLLTGIWITTSRSGLLAVVLGLAYIGAFFFPRTFALLAFAAGPALLAGLYLLRDSFVISVWSQLRYLPQALPMLSGASAESLGLPAIAATGVNRLPRWGQTMRLFLENPIWGNGFRATRWSQGGDGFFTTDNFFLEWMADTGLIGLLLTCLFFAALYLAAVRLTKRARHHPVLGPLGAGYQAALVGLIAINLLSGMFMTQKIWGVFILLSALVVNQLHAYARSEPDAPALSGIGSG